MSEESMNCCLTGCQKNLTHNRMIEIAETELKLNSCFDVQVQRSNRLQTKHQKHFFILFYSSYKISFRILDGERDKDKDRETERKIVRMRIGQKKKEK